MEDSHLVRSPRTPLSSALDRALTMASPALPSSAAPAPASALADLLKVPEDLSKLPALRRRLAREQAQITAKLNGGVRAQLEGTREGLRALQMAKERVGKVREEMGSVERLKEGRGKEDEAFEKIAQVRPRMCLTPEIGCH